VRVVGEARRCAEQVANLRFVLQELFPLLRSLGASRNSAVSVSAEVARQLQEFEKRAASFLDDVGRRTSALTTSGLSHKERASLARMLGLPCALVGMAVIPLQPVPHPTSWDIHVKIESQLFRYCIERTRPLQSFLQALSRAEDWGSRRALAREPSLLQFATELLASARTILSSCGLTGRGLQIPFRGAARFQLQHQTGSWILTVGPTRPRLREGPPVYVGVAIRGRTREERLSSAPMVSRTATGFFTPNGEPQRGGICMGAMEQYRHLHSPRFTDAEALLYWLDAALVLATGRSVFHQQWRAQSGRVPGRPIPLRSRRRRA
jgi:hypothetical protein